MHPKRILPNHARGAIIFFSLCAGRRIANIIIFNERGSAKNTNKNTKTKQCQSANLAPP